MALNLREHAWLDRQAGEIEQLLAGMDMPVRVDGEQVSRGSTRSRVFPLEAKDKQSIAAAAESLAQAIGVREVHVSARSEGLALESPMRPERELRLLPLLHALGRLDPLSALVGMTSRGRPLQINLANSGTRHVFIEGQEGRGKSELLRTLLLSLALTSRRSQMQVLAVDIGGRQLAVVEALPHALTDLATEVRFACELLSWLAEESSRRMEGGINRPHLVLLIDDLAWIETGPGTNAIASIERIIAASDHAGVHVLAAARDMGSRRLRSLTRASGVVRAVSARRSKDGGIRPGWFKFESLRSGTLAKSAWLSARDLQLAVDLVSSGWRTRGPSLVGALGEGRR